MDQAKESHLKVRKKIIDNVAVEKKLKFIISNCKIRVEIRYKLLRDKIRNENSMFEKIG